MIGRSQQERLETVCTLAATLADRALGHQLKNGTFASEDEHALRAASSLLEEYNYPVPSLVVDFLGRARRTAWTGGEAA